MTDGDQNGHGEYFLLIYDDCLSFQCQVSNIYKVCYEFVAKGMSFNS